MTDGNGFQSLCSIQTVYLNDSLLKAFASVKISILYV